MKPLRPSTQLVVSLLAVARQANGFVAHDDRGYVYATGNVESLLRSRHPGATVSTIATYDSKYTNKKGA